MTLGEYLRERLKEVTGPKYGTKDSEESAFDDGQQAQLEEILEDPRLTRILEVEL